MRTSYGESVDQKSTTRQNPFKDLSLSLDNQKSFQITKWTSGTFKPAEINYTVHEKELLAFVNALKKFQVDLRPVKFVFQTDNKWTTKCCKRFGLEEISLAYIDDIIVFTKGSKEEHQTGTLRLELEEIKKEIEKTNKNLERLLERI